MILPSVAVVLPPVTVEVATAAALTAVALAMNKWLLTIGSKRKKASFSL